MTKVGFGRVVAHFDYAFVRTSTYGIVGEEADFWEKE
jgi:hypothetical protein